MSRLREKTTATLLIAIFMISIFAVAIPVSAQTTWTVPGDFATIQEVIDSDDVQDGDTILVGEGEWYGGDIDKAVIVKGLSGAVIVDGPAYPNYVRDSDGEARIGFFIWPEGSGCTVEDFTFRGGLIGDTENYLQFAVFGRYDVSGVTVKSNEIFNCGQCISNVGGSNWIITHNVIEGAAFHGSLMGIFLPVSDSNIVSHNEITGEAPVLGRGITLSKGCYNEIVSNKITLTGPDAVAITLTAGIGEDPTPEDIAYAQSVLHDNIIRDNDLSGSTNQFSITPPELEEVNTIDVSTDVYELQLYEGWNLISLPLIPEDPSITVMLYDIIDYVESVWAYDGETGYWSSYSPGAPSDLTEMVDGKGYWIKMTTDMVWEITIV